MKNKYLFLVVAFIFTGITNISAQDSSWLAPESSNSIKNPFIGNEKATQSGKLIFNEMCILCHGLNGEGNGEAGLTLVRKPANFLALKVINESDGAIFWKITHGKSPMATYDELLTEDQRWKLVNYIRELESNRAKSKKQ